VQQLVSMRAESVSPILMHNPIGLMRQASAAPERGGKKIPMPEDEARAGLYRLSDGQLYIPADAVREASLIAAKDIRDQTRRGRASMMQRFGASVFLSREEFRLAHKDGTPITDDADDWEVHIKRAVVQRQGIMRSRALIRLWTAVFEFEYDSELVDKNIIYAIVDAAGRFPGLLDYRVGKKGPFGRYRLTELISDE
jgi:hypothetical protein